MADSSRLPAWVIAWLVLSSIVCFWDGSYILLRPLSSKGGSLNFLYKPYNLYAQVDLRYADMTDNFIIAQSCMNIVESCLNIVTIILHMQKQSLAAVIAFMVCTMTFSKTVLYFLVSTKFCHGAHYVNHNTWPVFIGLYLIPNGMWIVFPFLCLVVVGHQLAKCAGSAAVSNKRD